MSKLLSERVKKIPSTEVSDERYSFLKLSEAEPDLGVPNVSGYLLSSDINGVRTWVSPGAATTGFTGSQGATGFTGSGYTGSRGLQGYTGSQGFQGYTGSRGFTGSKGIDGYVGSQGATGFTGSKGDTGLGFYIAKTYSSVAALTADTSPTGIVAGQFAIIETGDVENPENSRLYLWNGSVYSYVSDLSGAQGITGPQGALGYTGSRGLTGFTGSAGSSGTNGTDGTNGFTGSRGFTGSQGTAGFTGSQGTAGFTGSKGNTGFTGSNGNTGFTGSKGNTGFTGSQGIQGVIGYTGSAGTGGGSGGSPWIYKTTNYTAVANDRIIADTSGGTITITLPATPVLSDMVTILDAGNANTTPITINRNGSTIEDSADNFVIDIENVQVEFVYDGTTWQIVSSVGRRGAIGYTGSRGLDGSFAGMGYTGSQGFTGSRGATTAVDVLAPTPATVGDFWFNTDQDQLKVYVDGQWVNSTPMYIPTGGTTNQILAKSSNTNYDFAWVSSVTETVYALAGTQISLANGSIQYKTQTTNTTYTETLTSGQSVTLLINSGGFTTTWPTISWVGGVAPTIALTGYSVIVLFKINSTLYGKHSGDVV